MIRFSKIAVALAISVCLVEASAAERLGREFKVNKITPNDQTNPSVASLGGGGFVVTWESMGQDGSLWGVYAQRYDAAGQRVGRNFRVNRTTTNDQRFPSVAGLGSGGFAVLWDSYGQIGGSTEVYGQQYDAAGARVGKREFRVNRTTTFFQSMASVAGLGDGGFVVTWQSQHQDASGDIHGQRYNAAGARTGRREFKAHKFTANAQADPSVAGLADGGFVVILESAGQDGSGYGIYGRRYNAAGARAGRDFRVNRSRAGDQRFPSVAALGGGGFVAIWQSEGQDGSGLGVYGQRYDAAGARIGNQFRVNSTTANNQGRPSVAGLGDDGFIVTWQSFGQEGGDRDDIYGQRYDAAGALVGGEFRVNRTTAGEQRFPSVAGLAGGGFVVNWQSHGQDGSGFGIFGQRYGP